MSCVRPIGLLLALLATSAPASAQQQNYQTFLIGTRAMGMGGAFTGVADDPSAAFHNPAGLGLILRSSTSANLSVTAIEGWVIEDGYGSALGPEDLEHDALPSLPLFVGFVQKFGDYGRDGVRQHGIALSVVRPALIRRRFRVDRSDPALGIADSIRVESLDSTEWYGVSYGARVDPGLAFGIGGWLSLRNLRHTEDRFVAEGILPAGARRTADRLFTRQSLATLASVDLVFRAGVLWQIDPQWRVGLKVHPGSIAISTTASIFSTVARTGSGSPPPVEELVFIEQNDLPGDAPMPWQLRLGGSFRASDGFGLSADLALYAPIGSPAAPVQSFGPPREDPVTGEIPSPGQFVARRWRSNVIGNASIGFDALIDGLVPIQAGLFTDFSAAPAIEGPSSEYSPPQIHDFGASVAGGIHRGDFDVQIGIAGVLGWGTGLGTNPDPMAPQAEAYVPRPARQHAIYFFLSGTERVAAQLWNELVGDTPEQDGGEPTMPPAPEPPREPVAPERHAHAPTYLRSPWPDLATEP